MTQPAEMDCPTCSVSLVMTDRQGIEIDYCPKCRGVWLDRGELDKIVERSLLFAAPSAPAPVAATPAAFGHQTPYHGKKRKSFLQELFD